MQNEWQLTHLFFSFEGNNASKWSEHFLPHQPALVRNIRDHNWTHEVTLQKEGEREREIDRQRERERERERERGHRRRNGDMIASGGSIYRNSDGVVTEMVCG